MTDPTPPAPSEADKGPMPSLTLIFTTDDEQLADWNRLLDIAVLGIGAIEAADDRFHILKAFTFYAGTGTESQAALTTKLAAAEAGHLIQNEQHILDIDKIDALTTKLAAAEAALDELRERGKRLAEALRNAETERNVLREQLQEFWDRDV